MGNREALLAGAKRCLYEKGYGRTTARDVASAAGVSLAAIGYHFRSLEALLNEAMLAALAEWGDEIASILPREAGGDPIGRMEVGWDRMVASVAAHRPLWAAGFEAFVQAEHAPELRAQLAAGQELARRGLGAAWQSVAEDAVGDATVRTVGSLQLALLSGLAVQWLVDPERAPSGRDLAEAMRAIAATGGSIADGAQAGPGDPLAAPE